MESKHHKQGDQHPEWKKDTLYAYSMKFCPFAHRTLLVLHHKNIPHEKINIDLKGQPDWFLERNPLGTVPTLEFNGKILWESGVCNDFLDEKNPSFPLHPSDPYEKARLRVVMERWGKVASQFFAIIKNPSDAETIKGELSKLLPVFEKEVKGKKYFGGDNVGMCDYHIWTHFIRLWSLTQMEEHNRLIGDFCNDYPGLASWKEEMMKVPAVQSLHMAPERYNRFLKEFSHSKIDYDAI